MRDGPPRGRRGQVDIAAYFTLPLNILADYVISPMARDASRLRESISRTYISIGRYSRLPLSPHILMPLSI